MEAIASRYRTAFGDVAHQVGIPAGQQSLWVIDLTEQQLESLAHATGADADGVYARTLRTYEGRAVTIDATTHRLRGDVPWGRMTRSPRSRFCPVCLAQNGGRWAISWRLPWTFACPEHNCLLRDTCPKCTRFQRIYPHAFGRIPTPGRCSISNKDTSWCGGDLTDADSITTLTPDHRILRAQLRIHRLIAEGTAQFGIYSEEPVCARTALTDTAILAARVAVHAARHRLCSLPQDAFIAAYEPGTDRPCAVAAKGHSRRLNLDAPVRAAEAAVYATAALEIIEAPTLLGAAQRMSWLVPRSELPAAEKILALGLSGSRALSAVQIKAYTPTLAPHLQLRYRAAQPTPTAPAVAPVSVDDIAPSLPSALWPEWSMRFGIAPGVHERWRPALASATLLVGTDVTAEYAAKRLGNNGLAPKVTRVLRNLNRSTHWAAYSVAITRLAEYLNTYGAPIDYDRRRRLDIVGLLPDREWQSIARRAGSLPGTPVKAEIARRYLFRKLTGMPSEQVLGKLRTQFYTRVLNFPLDMTSELSRALEETALEYLASNGIHDEPLSWHPPLELLDGAGLPTRKLDAIDTDALRKAASLAAARVPALAKSFGVDIDTIRYLLDRYPPASNTDASSSRQDIARAARYSALTKELFIELYHERRLGCEEIGRRFGMSSGAVRRFASVHGVRLRSQEISVDYEWLRANYVIECRTQTDLCAELGISMPTLRKWIEHHGLPIQQKPTRTARIEITDAEAWATLAKPLGRPGGRVHLENFARAVGYRSVRQAAMALGKNPITLNYQILRLEKDFAGKLLQRCTTNRPMAPTALGNKVLAAYRVLNRDL